jgi:methylmalonyl-CoA mutase cobalamin-binding subunit
MKVTKECVVIGGTESDTHVVSLYLAALMLEEHGYNVINRSCQNPISELMQGERGLSVLAYVICNQNGHALEDLKDLSQCKNGSAPVILGGHYTLGCHKKLSQQNRLLLIGVDMFAETLDELLPLLKSISAENVSRSRSNQLSLSARTQCGPGSMSPIGMPVGYIENAT